MRSIYNAKSIIEEILLGSNTEAIGFVNESSHSHFQKAHSFNGYNRNLDFSNEIVSVGLLNNTILEIGVNTQVASSQAYREHLRNDFSRKMLIPNTHISVQAKNNYRSFLDLSAGNKIAHQNLAIHSGWGTLGGFLLPQKQGQPMQIVSNNHVLANSNNANIGDNIYYMGSQPSVIGSLKNFKYIDPASANNLDLAVAEIPGFVNNGLNPGSSRNAIVGENVYKVGAKTGKTNGVVRSLHYTAKIDFNGFKAVFVDQIQITGIMPGFSFSAPGDSGSIIRSSYDNSFLGLLFAGNNQWTLANHQSVVLQQLKHWGYNVK